MYDYVLPAEVLVALQWLIANNPLYHDVLINDNWQQHHAAVQDDSDGDLLQAFLDQESIHSPKDSSPTERDCSVDGNEQMNSSFCLYICLGKLWLLIN